MNNTNAVAVIDRQLLALREVVNALREVQSIDVARDLRDRAKAIEVYMKQRDDAGEAAQRAGEVRLRAERRLGELLPPKPTPSESGARGGRGRKGAQVPHPLSDHREATRLRRLAAVPEPVFEGAIAEAKADGRVPSVAALIEQANEAHQKAEACAARAGTTAAALVADALSPKPIATRVRAAASKLVPGADALIALAEEMETEKHKKAKRVREALDHVREARRLLLNIADLEDMKA